MSVSSVNPTSSTTAGSSASAAASTGSSLTMSDFLTLMTAQLQNQNPLEPTDSSQLLSEMANMSTVEGITSMQSSLSNLSSSLLASSAVSSASLVGSDVLAQASQSTFSTGSTLSGVVQVPAGASGVTLDVQNASGTTVKQITIPSTEGNQAFTWDGTDSNGNAAPSGTYTFSASATVAGSTGSQTLQTLLPGTVSSVSLNSTTNAVTLNTSQLGSVAMSSVAEIN